MAVENCRDWAAEYIRETETLEVTAQCTVPNSGFEVRLIPTAVDDAPPRVLMLQVVVDRSKPEEEADTGKAVLYRRRTEAVPNEGGSPYEEVHVVNAGVILKVEEISRREAH